MSADCSCTMMSCQAPACSAEAFACCAHSANRNIALSVDDVDSLFYNAKKEGYMTTDLEELPFWENGVRFFKVTGPEGEVVELIQKL